MKTRPISAPSEECDEDLIPTRKSLLGRLKNWQDNESWRDFFNTYWKLIYRFALQRGLTHSEAEEVVQDTVLAVAKAIQKFEYDPAKCSFKSWLLTVTRSKIANQFARRPRTDRPAEALDDSGSSPLLDGLAGQMQWNDAWEDQWKQNLMDVAIQRVKERVAVEHYQMFDLFVLKGWPAKEVAATLGVTIAHVYVAKHRISKLIQKQFALLEDNPAQSTQKGAGR
jgi:RNA polymerase sigma factor (sigma-70 family)